MYNIPVEIISVLISSGFSFAKGTIVGNKLTGFLGFWGTTGGCTGTTGAGWKGMFWGSEGLVACGTGGDWGWTATGAAGAGWRHCWFRHQSDAQVDAEE